MNSIKSMFEKQYAYHKLDANTASLNTQTGQCYYDLKNSNIGKYDEIYRKIEAGDINNATLLNNQIAPVNNIEQFRKWVNAVYFDYIVTQKEIPTTVVEQLQLIADTPPCTGGEGVYTARAILGYSETIAVDNRSLEKQNEENFAEGTIIVYPNPANDEVFVLLDGYENGQKIEVELYNILGTLLMNEQIISSNETINISTAKIPAGSYILVLKTASKILNKNRLVIIK